MRDTDGSLWDDFRKGDDDAYVAIYKKHMQSLYYQGFHFTSDKEVVKDCIQEVFTKIYKYRANLADTQNIRYYLLAAMRNQLLTALAREKPHGELPAGDRMPGMEDDSNAEEELIGREDAAALSDKVGQVLSLLTPRQQEAVRYRYIECLDMEQICSLMELNYQSLQNILHRSLKKIRSELKIAPRK